LRGDVRLEVRVEARRVAPLPADGARPPGAAPRVAPTAVAPAAPVGTTSECRVDGVRLRRGGSLETHGHAFHVLWDQARGVELEVPRPLRAPAWRCKGLQYYGRAVPVVVAVLLRNRGVIVRRAVRRRAVVVWSDVMRLLRIVCPVPLTVRGTQVLVGFAPLAPSVFCAARQNAVLRRSPLRPT